MSLLLCRSQNRQVHDTGEGQRMHQGIAQALQQLGCLHTSATYSTSLSAAAGSLLTQLWRS